jgi:Ca2+-binding RTX toxin-like protein
MNADGSCEGQFVTDPPSLYRPEWRPGSVPGLGPFRCVDLRLTFVPAGGPAALGRDSPLHLGLDNDGNEVATGVRLELKTTEPSLQISDVNGGPGTACAGTPQDLVCALDPVPPGTPLTVYAAMRGSKAGMFPLTITATAIQTESDPSTNTLQTSDQVLPCTVVGTSSGDVLYGTPGPDRICGLPGPDRIYGLAGNDYLDGGSGADIITGGPGRDVFLGKGGSDTIYARDGQMDWIDCGTEPDVAIGDRLDVVRHCETVVRPRR